MTQSEEQPHVVVNDRRRIDPETGEVRPPAAEDAPAPASDTAEAEEGGRHAAPEAEVVDAEIDPGPGEPGGDQAAELKAQLDERTADLQRLTAEYANYRKRVERDRELVVNTAKANVAGELLGVLDDIERAGAHGDLTGAFKAVADKLVGALSGTGLEPFGHEGEAFDPSVHEAVQHGTSPDVTGPTVTAVLRRGYRFGERVLRPALVAVTDYEPAAEAASEQQQQD
ncbi:nucleotide exchange factor GrpE [Actinosynnema sp. NPDC047251]|uniref:Protein GrpE n=1 Tax=Saccharothrix espanaensis (strain ATCC 51144 / DSM 44229 / JCM 9112 / NBRC 15066 / NRRL 15764) TaxID=1179773 RepID=K0K5K5_SACES|nr:nucleotide exchange factor GrpE [Saccharothrix espanaensis]CCH35555.1 GrpE protein [Saccharothrix espanaensis DSM 44229]